MIQKKRTVEFDGKIYTVKSNKIEVPNLSEMDRFSALQWLIKNTYATGRGIRTKHNPLAGLGGQFPSR
jgi:hypothetical protein